MLQLHKYLPRLEDAVRDKRTDPVIDQLSEGDVRSLLYQVVDYYRRPFADSDALFDALIDAANENVDDFREASSAAASTRAQVLTRMLEMASESLDALSGKICTKITRRPDQTFEHHPHFRGVQMGESKRSKSSPGKARIISHRTWWIVSLAGDTEYPDPRWAVLQHRGEIDAQGVGEEFVDIELVSALELAEMTTSNDVKMMLVEFVKHLKNVGDADSKLVKMTSEDKALVKKMEAALAAMGTT